MKTVDCAFKAGDLVEIRGPAEIAAGLGADGTVDGLPFMPEMIQYCGQQFRLSCRAFKACVECFDKWRFGDVREFRSNDVWVLEELRCSGANHDGCQRGCLVFWHGSWLKKPDATSIRASHQGREELLNKLKTRVAPDKYFCQSTQLLSATQPLSRIGRFRICLEEVLTRNAAVFHVLRSIVLPIFWKVVHRYVRPRHVVGRLTKTPLVKLDLQASEVVEVRSADEIANTLNSGGCNRGLRYDHGLNKLCGTRQRVRDRLDKMIVESTGKMVQLEGTVTLEGTCCFCHMSAVGGCPRKDPIYWREAWLKRLNVAPSKQARRDLQATMH